MTAVAKASGGHLGIGTVSTRGATDDRRLDPCTSQTNKKYRVMKRFKNILFYAGTEYYSEALNRSITLAMENNAKLTLMDVVKPIPRTLVMVTDVATPEELEALIVKDHRMRLLDIEADCSDTGVDTRMPSSPSVTRLSRSYARSNATSTIWLSKLQTAFRRRDECSEVWPCR